MLHTIAISGYRSLQDIVLSLGQLNLITGPNGSGKSNIYRALRLLAAAVEVQGTVRKNRLHCDLVLAGRNSATPSTWDYPCRRELRLASTRFSNENVCGVDRLAMHVIYVPIVREPTFAFAQHGLGRMSIL